MFVDIISVYFISDLPQTTIIKATTYANV